MLLLLTNYDGSHFSHFFPLCVTFLLFFLTSLSLSPRPHRNTSELNVYSYNSLLRTGIFEKKSSAPLYVVLIQFSILKFLTPILVTDCKSCLCFKKAKICGLKYWLRSYILKTVSSQFRRLMWSIIVKIVLCAGQPCSWPPPHPSYDYVLMALFSNNQFSLLQKPVCFLTRLTDSIAFFLLFIVKSSFIVWLFKSCLALQRSGVRAQHKTYQGLIVVIQKTFPHQPATTPKPWATDFSLTAIRQTSIAHDLNRRPPGRIAARHHLFQLKHL
jgi:hypothetical protein